MKKIPNHLLIQDLQRVCKLTKRATCSSYAEHGTYNTLTLIRHFGTFKAACKAAGVLDFTQKIISSDELIDDLHRVAVKLGKLPTHTDYMNHGQYAFRTFYRRFGSWPKAQNKLIKKHFNNFPKPWTFSFNFGSRKVVSN